MPLESQQRRPASLALRLTTSIALAITVVFLVLGWVVERSIERHFAEQDAEELQVVAHSLQQELQTSSLIVPMDRVDHRLAGAVKGHHGMYYYVADATGRQVFATPGPSLEAIARTQSVAPSLSIDHLRIWQDQNQSYRGAVIHIYGPPGSPQPYTAVVATAMGFHEHFLASFHRTIWLATAVAALVTILATWFAVYRGHAPLRDISARIRGISADQLHLRLKPDQVPIELAELATAFNAMIERIEQDFRSLSNFSADIAHELRTPVTNLVTQTQVLLTKGRSMDEYKEVLYSNLEEYERMAKMIGDMLYLAQTDHQLIKPTLAGVDLASEVQALFEYFDPLADEQQVRLEQSGHGRIVRGDRLMLRRALSNLLSNAIRHTSAGQAVTVTMQERDDAVLVTVTNPGTDIPPEHLPHLFDRFYRVDPSRQRHGDGAGLGLAIVKSIVEAHGGEIAVRSHAGVTAFEIRLTAVASGAGR
jgi:two-component system heavy metal sensor histidine kinase CusS